MTGRQIAAWVVIVFAILGTAWFYLSRKAGRAAMQAKVEASASAADFEKNGPANLKPASAVGTPTSGWSMADINLPFAGIIPCPHRLEKMKLPRADGSFVELEVKVFYGPSGEPVRIERTADPKWKRLWSNADIEGIMENRNEKIYGVSSASLPGTWQSVFGAMRDHVELEKATHFDITWVDYQFAGERFSAYICNDYGDRTFWPGTDEDDPDLKRVRVRIFPGEDGLRFDSVL